MLIDTHAHLWFPDFENNLEEVLTRAKVAGVEKIIVPGTDIESSRQVVELAKKYPGVIYASIGVHPEEVLGTYQNSPGLANARLNILADSQDLLSRRVLSMADEISKFLRENRHTVVAIGEIGTDASSEELRSRMGEQKELFKLQCELALEHDLPVIIHTRNSLGEALEILDSLPKMPRGQFHCFSHDEGGLKEVLRRGFYVSFAGNITWSKRVEKLVSLVPDDKLLLETDSPFMMPRIQPSFALESSGRVKNEPAKVRILGEKIAELRGRDLEKLAEITRANAISLFRL